MDQHAAQLLPLESLRAGEHGRIVKLDGPADAVHRLEEMGLRTGAAVRMVQTGSPCILAIDEQRLSFRADAATVVMIEIL
ncbi:MAG: FeoA family protein [Planctomycetaceae bacterium]